jgi:ATP-binding cassette, sub-family E, member 1
MPRIAIVDKKRCAPENCGNFLCMRVCPVNRRGDECITKGEDSKAAIAEKLCIGCGICQKKCPFEAISIINLPEQLNSSPIHNYGPNGFHLYNLPMPVPGKVVGIIGKNGIGKTTAINILSGLLKPSLGKKGHKASLPELMQHFRGTELHNHFELLHTGKLKVAVKPQQVSLLKRAYKGTVAQFLLEMDQNGKLDELSEALELKPILSRDISKISGGELQKVAIAGCVLKQANVYFFDEPTSYLDIKQRIMVSKFIRGLADENTAVLVIEHDLIILDYMTDLVHITFGTPAAYGVVAGLANTKEGINEYLAGFLRAENLRFREHAISFDDKPPLTAAKSDSLVAWEGLSKRFNGFSFFTEDGEVFKKHVVGVLGENGIGKSTFMKLLAGEETPDSGKLSANVGISYKPQYIDTDSVEPVRLFLKDALKGYQNELIGPLGLSKLLDEPLNALSGGELQRVMIAKCLSDPDAELFLLDEPSAYLDVEQRLQASKLISNLIHTKGKTALIVDHDLLFVDYLSEDLIVFDGQPAIRGNLKGPYPMEKGMNAFLTGLNLTLRREKESKRPRINKPGSKLDREQKGAGKLYYS